MGFWKCAVLTALISAVPVVELRGGLPFGLAGGLTPLQALLISTLGNLLPVPFIILLVRRVFLWLKKSAKIGPWIEKLETRAHLKGRIVQKYRLWGLMILVAIPLPGTGAWTGALVAAVLDIRLRSAMPAIAAGVVIAGLLILTISLGVREIF